MIFSDNGVPRTGLLSLKMKWESESQSSNEFGVITPTLDILIKLLRPWILHLEDKNNNTYCTELLTELNEVRYMKVLFNTY